MIAYLYCYLYTPGQLGPFIGTALYPESDKPYYVHGMAACAGFMLLVGKFPITSRYRKSPFTHASVVYKRRCLYGCEGFCKVTTKPRKRQPTVLCMTRRMKTTHLARTGNCLKGPDLFDIYFDCGYRVTLLGSCHQIYKSPLPYYELTALVLSFIHGCWELLK